MLREYRFSLPPPDYYYRCSEIFPQASKAATLWIILKIAFASIQDPAISQDGALVSVDNFSVESINILSSRVTIVQALRKN